MADVAASAGVSLTTASYVLNDRAREMRISDDAEQRVRDAVTRLSYRPNRNARSLRTSRTATLGVISDHVASGSYSSLMLSGAAAAARARHHLVVIGETEGDRQLERDLVEELIDRQVDGFLYATRTLLEVDVPDALRTLPVVLLNCVDRERRLPSVVPDEVGAGRLAASTLVTAGRADALFVVGEDATPGALADGLRRQGMAQVLGQAGVEVAGTLRCRWDVREAFATVKGSLAAGTRPTSFVCLNDRVAMGTYQAVQEAGLWIPADVSIVSFDGSELAGWLQPRVSSIALPFNDMGARAVDILLDPDRVPDVVHVPMPMLDGESVAGSHARRSRHLSTS
ncbi:LacI family DNA-binding transcriptional regulator [Nocardioides mangrovicus]|uniref:LacI family DNA-binding transcriptional regulator n=1 Tax=Nocardioides mangrovicus TaxID=2478913 RepID=A0A3L8P7U2_9ACTN|nr:LacI family DNA-binding transcriptional regulator [Nocardioides mangrovicus]